MRLGDLSQRWKLKIQEYLAERGVANPAILSASDFPSATSISIGFEDGLHVKFKYAFVIKAPDFREVAMFTEHCGYHLFSPYDGLDLVVE